MPDHPDSLAKYCDAATAQTILSSQRLRWRAPHLLGDPFELNHLTPLSFDPHSMLEGVIRTASAMIFAKDHPRGNSPLANVVRRWRDEERFASPEEAEEVLRELMSRMVDQRQAVIDTLMADWRRYTRQLRICSFSARPDNLPCWQHYANQHRGAVIRFHCRDYGTFKAPRAVDYRSQRPEITSLKEQLNALLYNEGRPAQEQFPEKFLAKSLHAAAELEWRCFYQAEQEASSRDTNDHHWYDDRPFERSEVAAVYFGAFMVATERRKLFELARAEYPEVRIFQAQVVPGKFEIEFTRVTRQD